METIATSPTKATLNDIVLKVFTNSKSKGTPYHYIVNANQNYLCVNGELEKADIRFTRNNAWAISFLNESDALNFITKIQSLSLPFTVCHMTNAITWQANAMMKVELETLKKGEYPNGDKITPSDILKINESIANCTAILESYHCEIPALKDEPGDQFKLF